MSIRTAKQAYEENISSIQKNLKVLNKKVKTHKANFSDNPNWGDVGDMARIAEHLEELINPK